ncbi:MAG: c-type cytochrome domain-containing protein [Verrucomicrobiota bacterium]
MALEPDKDVSTIDLNPYRPRSTRSRVAFVWTMVLGVVLVGGLLLMWLNFPNLAEGSVVEQFALFFGNFHPIAIHAPIALLAVALFVEIFGRTPLARSWRGQGGMLLWIGTIGAVVAVLLGYMLGVAAEWRGKIYETHQWTGIAVAVTALLATLLRSVNRQGLSLCVLVICVGFVSYAGFMGGELTHGKGHLGKYMPSPLKGFIPEPMKAFLGVEDDEEQVVDAEPEVVDADPVIYTSLIVPMFERSCYECHGAETDDGGLRMHTYEDLLKEGDGGIPGVTPGDIDESETHFRVTLDPDDEEFMPTKGEPLSADEVKILEWWITEGNASPDARVSEVEQSPEITAILESNTIP